MTRQEEILRQLKQSREQLCVKCSKCNKKDLKENMSQCYYCNKWFCVKHELPKHAMAFPGGRTGKKAVKDMEYWKMEGHFCFEYNDIWASDEILYRKGLKTKIVNGGRVIYEK